MKDGDLAAVIMTKTMWVMHTVLTQGRWASAKDDVKPGDIVIIVREHVQTPSADLYTEIVHGKTVGLIVSSALRVIDNE